MYYVCHGMYWNILVRTGMYWYVLVYTDIYSTFLSLVCTQGFVVRTGTLPCCHLLPSMEAWRIGIPIPVQKTRSFLNAGLMQQIWKRQ